MIFINRLKLFFLAVLVISSLLLIYIWYKDYSFNHSPLDNKTSQELLKKEYQLKQLTLINFNITPNFPIIISDKLDNRHFGLATYNNGKIAIYLNKKHFKESKSYMIDDVLPHEYAHALMFVFNKFSSQNGGHTKEWQEICKKLNGLRCDRFVNHRDIIIGKTNFFE